MKVEKYEVCAPHRGPVWVDAISAEDAAILFAEDDEDASPYTSESGMEILDIPNEGCLVTIIGPGGKSAWRVGVIAFSPLFDAQEVPVLDAQQVELK